MKPKMNWIYHHIYFLALQTPSKKTADDVATMFVGAFAAMHLVLLAYVIKHLTGAGLASSKEAPAIVGVCLVCIALAFYYYAFLKNGARVIRAAKESGRQPRLIVAVAIILETVFLPIWAIPLLLLVR